MNTKDKPQKCTVCKKSLDLQTFDMTSAIGKCKICGTFYNMPNGRKKMAVPKARIDENHIRRYRYYWQKSEHDPIVFRGMVNKFLHRQIVE